MTSPTEGGSGGASPPAFMHTTGTSKSPSEAVFIICWYRLRDPRGKGVDGLGSFGVFPDVDHDDRR